MAQEHNYIGKQIGNYRIVEELASGSFGRVYKGLHIYLTKRIVAIKLLHHMYLGSQKERDSFLQEAQLLEMLKHPHILPIYDVGIEDGIPYFVAEYAQNGSLRDRLLRQHPHPLPVDEAITILSQIGQALAHAHSENIIHRDLKPENILFSTRGEALLADFGIAVVLKMSRTAPVDIIGSPLYMAPEQFDGMLSKRSDQYALACIAYEMLTGRNPFRGPSAVAMALKHKTEIPVAPTQFNTYLPVSLERAILKALSKERNDRYPDVASFIAALSLFPAQKTQEQWLDEGNQLHDLGRYAEALQAYERAIQLDPSFPDAHEGRGDALFSRGSYQEALQAYDRAIQLNPRYAHAYEGKGNALYNLKHYAEALDAYEKAIQLDSASAAAYNGKGDALYYLNRYQEALLAYERAIQLDPYHAHAHNGKSWTLWHFRRHEEALIAAEQAIRLNAQLADAYNSKGNALYHLKRFRESLEAYEQALRLDANLVYALDGKGWDLWRLKRSEEALLFFDRALSLSPNYASSHHGKGNALYALGRLQEALAAYDRAIQIKPQLARAYSSRGRVLHDFKRYEEALAVQDRATLLEPTKAVFHFYKSRTLRQMGRVEEAQRSYDKAKQLGFVTVDKNR